MLRLSDDCRPAVTRSPRDLHPPRRAGCRRPPPDVAQRARPDPPRIVRRLERPGRGRPGRPVRGTGLVDRRDRRPGDGARPPRRHAEADRVGGPRPRTRSSISRSTTARGAGVLQRYWDDEPFDADRSRTFSVVWIPSAAVVGELEVRVGIFRVGWGALHHWNDSAAVFDVLPATAPPPTTPPPPPPHRPRWRRRRRSPRRPRCRRRRLPPRCRHR